ncbi:hypothetical protein [Sphingobacterium faecium]|uniref:hypothetical protein n=1 Tax=Sphingobacterium faecium TaxID=34087 RepID=UPI0024698A65|nr:hypothetical protein [Sphingobacterium faecium]MDH5825826.1 hypothetical protein [Sphingobacterium faecium]
MPWYSFTPGAATPQDPSDPAQYTNVGGSPPTCLGGPKVCAIQANDLATKPIFTTALYREIIRAQHNAVGSTNVLMQP